MYSCWVAPLELAEWFVWGQSIGNSGSGKYLGSAEMVSPLGRAVWGGEDGAQRIEHSQRGRAIMPL